jgi:hypothetical protein
LKRRVALVGRNGLAQEMREGKDQACRLVIEASMLGRHSLPQMERVICSCDVSQGEEEATPIGRLSKVEMSSRVLDYQVR